MRSPLATTLLAAIASLNLRASDLRLNEIPLQTELKFSGPSVSVRAPLGLRYRPGYAIPLQVRVHNPGAEFHAEVFVVEGSDGARSGIFERVHFPAQTARVLNFPVRAPAVAANLSLVIRELDASGAAGPLRFQSSLARALKPLPPEARVILSSGSGVPLQSGAQQEVAQVSAAEFLDQDWMYESLDLVILADDSFKDASPAAQQALRRWLCSGGRLLLASSGALQAAVAARLLPLDYGAIGGVIGADRPWWEKHAGLTADGVLFQKYNRPVYIHLSLGFGEIVLLFPASSTDDAREFGAAAVNHLVLQRPREKFPDIRVQPDRFAAFVPGAVGTDARGRAALWFAMAALLVCVGLALAFTSRSRMVAAGWPPVVMILAAVLLAKWFPARELSVSRVQIVRQSLDGMGTAHDEWALVEAFKEPLEISAGNAAPLYADTSELKDAAAELSLREDETRLRLAVSPQQPALLAAKVTEATAPEFLRSTRIYSFQARSEKTSLVVRKPIGLESSRRAAVWARADGSLRALKNISPAGEFDLAPFDDWVSVLHATGSGGGEDAIRARAAALGWASREALRSQRDTLIFWDAPPGEHGGVIQIESPAANAGSLFRIYAAQATAFEL